MVYLTQNDRRKLKKFLKKKGPDYVLVYYDKDYSKYMLDSNITMKKYGDNIETVLKNGEVKRGYNFKKLFDDLDYYFFYNGKHKEGYNINKEIIEELKLKGK